MYEDNAHTIHKNNIKNFDDFLKRNESFTLNTQIELYIVHNFSNKSFE